MWIYAAEKLSDKTWQEAEHCVKSVPIRTEITPYLDTFYAVEIFTEDWEDWRFYLFTGDG